MSRSFKQSPRSSQRERPHLPHVHARSMAPKEGILPMNITEDQAHAIELMAIEKTQTTEHVPNTSHSSSTMGAPQKGNNAWKHSQQANRGDPQATLIKKMSSVGSDVSYSESPGSFRQTKSIGTSNGGITKAESMKLASTPPHIAEKQRKQEEARATAIFNSEDQLHRPPSGCYRLFCYRIAESKWFDRFILLCIIVNSVTLAFYDPRGLSNIDEAIPLKVLDNLFLAIFIVEMIIKVSAYGFYTTTAQSRRDAAVTRELAGTAKQLKQPKPAPLAPRYLDVNWNRLDFFIVLASVFSFILDLIGRSSSQDLDVLRALRMLRPLRTVNSIPEMRVLIDSLGESAKPMANVMLLCLLLYLIFALIGQQLFSGAMTQRCYKPSAQSETSLGRSSSRYVNLNGKTLYSHSMELMPDNQTEPIYSRRCGGEYSCPSGYVCSISGYAPKISNPYTSTFGDIAYGGYSKYANPNFGMVSYDDIGHALLNIFVAVTLEGWVDQMYWLQDSYNKYVAVIFFLALIIFGSLFALNLALAVISDNYSANVMRENNRVAEIKASKGVGSFSTIRQRRQAEFEEIEEKRALEFQERMAAAAAAAAAAEMLADTTSRDVLSSDHRSHDEVMAKAREAAEVAARLEAQSTDRDTHRRLTHTRGVLRRGASFYRPRNKFRATIHDLVMHVYFDSVIMFCIFVNTIILAIPHYTTECLDSDGRKGGPDCIKQAAPMDETVTRYLEEGNTYFLYIFTMEVVLKMVGLGFSQFLVDRFNIFDLLIVLFGYLEFIPLTRLPGGNNILSAFRIFRLARVFKAAKYWSSMQAIIKTLMDTLPSLFYLTVVLCLLMFIAACSGMQLFGDVGIPNSYRANFSDFGTSMITVFQILTGENWNEIMNVAVGHTSYPFCFFFIFTFIVGGFVILNLYLAILLSAFDCGEPPEFSLAWVSDIWKDFTKTFDKVSVRKHGRGISTEMDKIYITANHLSPDTLEFDEEMAEQEKSTLSNEIASKEVERHVVHREKKTEAIRRALDDKSCGCISKHNRFRLRLARVVHTQRFDDLILVLIIVSTLILAFESPKLTECGSDCSLFVVLFYADVVFTLLFIIEMVMKIIVYGFINSKAAYLKDPWNVMDFTIVLVGTISLVTSVVQDGASLAWIRSLRALRALRPLRTIRRAPGMRMAVNTLFDCAPAFLNIGCVAFVFYLAFAIIGVEFFGGKFWRCNDESVSVVEDCVGVYFVKTDGAADFWAERRWYNPPMNFDNTGTALLTLFEIAGLELWMTPMYSAMDATHIGQQPQRNNNRYAAFYFLVFILFGSFLVMNLFVGAVVDNFNRQTKRDHHHQKSSNDSITETGSVTGSVNPSISASTNNGSDDNTTEARSLQLVTPSQKAFMNSVGLLFSRKPITRPIAPDPDSSLYSLRRQSYNLVMWGPIKNGRRVLDGSYFEINIMAIVCLNTLAMLCYTWNFPDDHTFYEIGVSGDKGLPDTVTKLQSTPKNNALDFVNNFFTFIFNLELILKLLAWGLSQYFADRWNKLDAFVVGISDFVYILETAISSFNAPININLVRILRLVKILRVLRVLSRGKEVIFLIETLLYSFPAIANVAALWLLVIFIYTIIGVSLYGEIPVDSVDYQFGMYNEHANFRNFGTGIVTLFRMSTGESWNGIMHDVMEVYPSAYIFFSSYILLVAYLLFNLLVAIVLQQFHMESSQDDSLLTTIGGDQMACFQDEWVRFDPFATEYIKAVELPLILRRLPNSLCPLDDDSSSTDVIRTLAQLTVNVDFQGRVHFAETYIALITYAYNRQTENEADNDLTIESLNGIMPQIVAHYPALATQQLTDKPIVEYFAAQRLQALWHRAHARRNWDQMLQKLRELRDSETVTAKRTMFSLRGGRASMKRLSKIESPNISTNSSQDFGFPDKIVLDRKDDDINEQEEEEEEDKVDKIVGEESKEVETKVSKKEGVFYDPFGTTL